MFAHALLVQFAGAHHARGAVSQRLELHKVDLRGVDAPLFRAMKHMRDEELLVEAGGSPEGDSIRFTQAFALTEQSKACVLGLRCGPRRHAAPKRSPHLAPRFDTIGTPC